MAIVDDDLKLSNDLVRMLGSTSGLRCAGAYSSFANALDGLSISMPDVVLMDINLPAIKGVECVRRLKAACQKLSILVFTETENADMAFNLFSAGAVGYLLKPVSPKQLIAAIHEVYAGGSPMSGAIARRMVDFFQQTFVMDENYWKLSQRELQVMGHLAKGLRYKEIADELNLSYSTVHTHIRHIYKKMRVNSRTNAVSSHLRHVSGWQNRSKSLRSEPVPLLNRVGIPGKSYRLTATAAG